MPLAAYSSNSWKTQMPPCTTKFNGVTQDRICNPARQSGDFGRNFAYFLVIFRLFSAYGTPSAVFSPHVYGICLFPPISVSFLPIFRLKWYPILVINSSMEPICCFSTHMFMDSAYFPPYLLPIFRRSCLAGNHVGMRAEECTHTDGVKWQKKATEMAGKGKKEKCRQCYSDHEAVSIEHIFQPKHSVLKLTIPSPFPEKFKNFILVGSKHMRFVKLFRNFLSNRSFCQSDN